MAASSPYFQNLYRLQLETTGHIVGPWDALLSPARELSGHTLDWALAEPRTEYLTGTAAITTAGYFLTTKGLAGLLGNLENVGAAAVLLYGPGRWLRGRRGIGSHD
jgi:hypothetical protein